MDLQTIAYAADGAHGPGRQRVYTSPLDLEATVAALEEAVAAEDLWVVAKLDPQMLLAKGGFAIRPARQIFYFHPRFMSRLLQANPAAIVEAPLKVVAMAGPDGSVSLRHPDVAAAFASYPGMSEIAAELEAITQRIIARVAG
ncbi:MAG: DUF302 domain-containing protein [Hyphomicrobiaceae bacterium]|nr:DUF302 domain-containing protein [Hyphomicrobiaceae bacterium]